MVAFYANAVDIYDQIKQESNKENMGSRKVRILSHLILEPFRIYTPSLLAKMSSRTRAMQVKL